MLELHITQLNLRPYMYSDICLQLLQLSKTTDDLGSHAKSHRAMYRQLKRETNFLPDSANARERLWYVEHDTTHPPLCKMCTSPVKWNNLDRGFQRYCSVKCARSDPAVQEQIANTSLARYGVKCSAQHEDIRNMQLRSFIKTTHNISDAQLDSILEYTKFLPANVPFSQRNWHFHNKTSSVPTCKYCSDIVSWNAGTNQYQKYCSASCYHDDLKSAEVRNRRIQLRRDSMDPEDPNYPLAPETLIRLNDREWLTNQLLVHKRTLQQIAADLSVSHSVVSRRFATLEIPIQRFPASVLEKNLVDEIKTIYSGEVVTNVRSIIAPQELDIYIPEFNFAIEINGIYWHGETSGKGRSYHLNKTNACEHQGIQLFHIYDSELINHHDIVMSRIAHKLQLTKTRFYARQLELRNVSHQHAREFFNQTHIQQYVPAQISYGLYDRDNLVYCASFSPARFNKHYQFELIRASSALDAVVVGGLSRITKHFRANTQNASIISYADRRWSTIESGYSKTGFQFGSITPPNQFYFHKSSDSTKLLSRHLFQKHKLANKFANFDPRLSAWDNIKANGYDRIWDCGNISWVLSEPS